jgi:quercetin dioxygenase-like cupin family protein
MRTFMTAMLVVTTIAWIGGRGTRIDGATVQHGAHAKVVMDNALVRVYKATGADAGADHPGAVVIALTDGRGVKAGDAYWTSDASAEQKTIAVQQIVVAPKAPSSPGTPAPPPPGGSKPGDSPFTGMSFSPMFQNDRVAVIRARMDVGAQEGVHTHGSDILVVYLTDGTIEDTANGTTKVNRWKHGDVELETKGSSHSARNIGPAIDVVLVTLKP